MLNEKVASVWLLNDILYAQPLVMKPNYMWCAHEKPIYVLKSNFPDIGRFISLIIEESGKLNILPFAQNDGLFYDLLGVKNDKQIAKKGGLYINVIVYGDKQFYNPHYFEGNYNSMGEEHYVHLDSLEPEELERKLWVAFEKCKVGK